MPEPSEPSHGAETSAIATLQSLIVAFVLAMTFRGFVTEGFVIPTGSMAPTLLGEHLLLHSSQTGDTFAVDSKRKDGATAMYDPLLGRNYKLSVAGLSAERPRMGDRILVLKCLYPFFEPDRFDVVVFKNPTDPNGDAENYIKRLIGLPNEAIWLADGDVFVAPSDESGDPDAYEVQRKPDYIQRAVWQPVQDSNFIPLHPDRLSPRYAAPWFGQEWRTNDQRSYRCDTAEPTTLDWDSTQIRITDWTPYNMFTLAGAARPDQAVSDLRVTADIVADQPGLSIVLDLEARDHVFQFRIAGGTTEMRMRPQEDPDGWTDQVSAEAPAIEPGRVYSVEFWHVDQAMTVFVNGRQVGPRLEYEWTPAERVEWSFGVPYEAWLKRTPALQPVPPSLRWTFDGSPLTIHRMQVDRDLYYRPDTLTTQTRKNPTQPEYEDLVEPRTPAFGTHPDKPALLGPDQYFMLGDNSPASSDSRLWGNPHPLVARQIDDSPFVVNRKLLLGKAWVVYFPAPYPISENGRGVVPDFGRLRFIR